MELFNKELWSQNTNQLLLSSSIDRLLTWIKTGEKIEEIKKG